MKAIRIIDVFEKSLSTNGLNWNISRSLLNRSVLCRQFSSKNRPSIFENRPSIFENHYSIFKNRLVSVPRRSLSSDQKQVESSEDPKKTEEKEIKETLNHFDRIKKGSEMHSLDLQKFMVIKDMVFGLIIAIGMGAWAYHLYKSFLSEKEQNAQNEKAREKHLRQLGGPFTLVNSDNEPVTEKDFMGKFTMLYFGFTHCPDVCPDTLDRMDEIYNDLQKNDIGHVNMVFVSVDPQRDSPESIKEYLMDFNPHMVGLTGSVSQVKDIAEKFRIYYSVNTPDSQDYLVDHTSLIYFIDPDWKFVDFYSLEIDKDQVINRMIRKIKAYREEHSPNPSLTTTTKT